MSRHTESFSDSRRGGTASRISIKKLNTLNESATFICTIIRSASSQKSQAFQDTWDDFCQPFESMHRLYVLQILAQVENFIYNLHVEQHISKIDLNSKMQLYPKNTKTTVVQKTALEMVSYPLISF